jgi:hypothetical protein
LPFGELVPPAICLEDLEDLKQSNQSVTENGGKWPFISMDFFGVLSLVKGWFARPLSSDVLESEGSVPMSHNDELK